MDQSSVKRSKEVEKRIDGEGVESGSVVDPRKGGKGTEEEKRRLKDAGRRAERRKKVEVIAYLVSYCCLEARVDQKDDVATLDDASQRVEDPSLTS